MGEACRCAYRRWLTVLAVADVDLAGEFVITSLQEAGRARRSVLRTDHGWLWPFIRSWQVWVGKNPPFKSTQVWEETPAHRNDLWRR